MCITMAHINNISYLRCSQAYWRWQGYVLIVCGSWPYCGKWPFMNTAYVTFHPPADVFYNLLPLKILQDQTHLPLNPRTFSSPENTEWTLNSWVTFSSPFPRCYFHSGKCTYRISVTKKGREVQVYFYAHFSVMVVLQFTQGTSMFASKVTKNMLSK